MPAELYPAGATQADAFDTRGADHRRLMTAQDTINRRIGRDTVFDAGAGIHRDWKAFSTPALSILHELRHMRSASWATTRQAWFGRTDTIREQPSGTELDVE
jgi:hypothetical protein